MSQPLVTIDGPAGVGKTTIAGLLAQKLDLPRMDTGAMFRYLALYLGEHGLAESDKSILAQCADLNFELAGTGPETELLVNGKPIGAEIRSEKVGKLASAIATRPVIRQILLAAQQQLGKKGPLVAEGRDLGTVVFPHAKFKFFLDASPEIRAVRRWREFSDSGKSPALSDVAQMISERDEQDRNRLIAPLKPAQDAVVIDTSRLDIPHVLMDIYGYIQKNGGLFPMKAHAQ